MERDGGRTSRTRRSYLTAAGAALAAGLAGCSGGNGGTDTPGTTTTTSGDGEDGTTRADHGGGPYSVSMVPVGEVTFEEPPETWVANNGSWADMGVALGQDPPEGVWLPSRYHTHYYDEIPGVSVDGEGIQKLWGEGGPGKEQFYAIDADVHVVDPNFLRHRGSWAESDLEEIGDRVAPLFGNSIFSRGYPWHSDYRYYSLLQATEKLAAVFDERARYEALESIHANFQANLAPHVPGPAERSEAAVVWGGGDAPEQFYPYVIDGGTSFKHLRDLGVRDALASTDVKDFYTSRGAIDFETLLEVDPEVLLLRGQEATDAAAFEDTVVAFLEDHDVAGELTAVQNGDVYRAGPLYQGPITNLVVTERLAGTLYGVEEALFDRERVAAVVDGDV